MVASVALAAACAPPAPAPPSPALGYEFPATATLPNSDRVFLVLTFSGGGVRATALSFAVLEQLIDDSLCVDGHRKSVADEVDIISAVSGGSFTAAQFALYGKEGLPVLANEFLYKLSQTELKIYGLHKAKELAFFFPRTELIASS